MKNADPKAETMVVSLDVSPKITHKPWEEKDYSSKLNHKAPELDDHYTTHIYWPGKSRRIHWDMSTLPVTSNRAVYIYFLCSQKQISCQLRFSFLLSP